MSYVPSYMNGLQAIFFDFVGVLAESVEVKTKAFISLYKGVAPDVLEKIVAYHRYHGGVSRFEKIRYFQSELLSDPVSDNQLELLAKKFSNFCEELVVASEWVPGARELLEVSYGKKRLFVVSGTPENELRRIVKKRGMWKYFDGVFGAPAQKKQIIAQIMSENNFDATKVLFVGDSITDYEAVAEYKGCMRFLGRVPAGELSPFPLGTVVVEDFCGVKSE